MSAENEFASPMQYPHLARVQKFAKAAAIPSKKIGKLGGMHEVRAAAPIRPLQTNLGTVRNAFRDIKAPGLTGARG
jgi:hypothetical protein